MEERQERNDRTDIAQGRTGEIMGSKAQDAATKAIEDEQRKFYENLDGAVSEEREPLDLIEKHFVSTLKRIEDLIRDYELNEDYSRQFRKNVLGRIYEEAGRRKMHVWQASFAKRHSL